MSDILNLSTAYRAWQDLAENIPTSDRPARAESWNDYTDSLQKDGQLLELQTHYAPAHDEEMPGEGRQFDPLADDREMILAAMGVTMCATFVPQSASRNAGKKENTLNWRITLSRNGRQVSKPLDYSQGAAHCPAYSQPYAGTENTPYNRDGWKRRAVAQECESGKRAIYRGGHIATGGALSPPDLQDVFYCLLSDSSVIDAGGFENWCSDYGYDSDSIKAKATYDACVETFAALRAAFSARELEQLQELFQDM